MQTRQDFADLLRLAAKVAHALQSELAIEVPQRVRWLLGLLIVEHSASFIADKV